MFSWSDAAEKQFTVWPHKIAVMQESNPCSVSTVVYYHLFLARSASLLTCTSCNWGEHLIRFHVGAVMGLCMIGRRGSVHKHVQRLPTDFLWKTGEIECLQSVDPFIDLWIGE